MRFILIYIGLLLSCTAFSQADTIFVLPADFGASSAPTDTTYQVQCTHPFDQLGQAYIPSKIQVGYQLFDAYGNQFRVLSIDATTLGSSTLTIVELQNSNAPSGSGIVYRKPDDSDCIPLVQVGNVGISPVVATKIHNHNVANGCSSSSDVDELIAGKLDTVLVVQVNDSTFAAHNYIDGVIVRADTITIRGTGGGSGSYVDRDARGDAILDDFSSDSIPNYYVIYDQEPDVTGGNEIGGVLWRTSDLNFVDGDVLTMIGKYAAAGARSYLEFGSGQNSNVISIHPQDGLMGILTDSPRVSFDINTTDAISIPTGITSNRPGSPYFGLLRGNSTTGFLEYYDGSLSSWRNLLARDPDGNLQIDSYDSGTLPNYLIFSDDDIDVATSQFSGGLKWQTSDINRSGVYVNWLENQYISTGAAAQIVLGTDINSNRFSFDTFNGRLGLMTTTPSYTLDIQSSSASILLNPHDNTLLGTEGLLYADDGDNRPKYHNGTSFESLAYLSDLGGGGVTGTGTTNYMPVWSGASALTDSPVYVDGDSLGIGTTSPEASVLHLKSSQTADRSLALLMEVPVTGNNAYGLGWKEQGRTQFYGIQSQNMNGSASAQLRYDYIDPTTPANTSEQIFTIFPNRVVINPSSTNASSYGQTLEFGNGKDYILGFADMRIGSLARVSIMADVNNNSPDDTSIGLQLINGGGTATMMFSESGRLSFGSTVGTYTIDAATRTDGFRIPQGSTAQRPTGTTGLFRYNTTTGKYEGHDGADFKSLMFSGDETTAYTPTSTADATGNEGDIAYDDNYIYIKTSAGWKRAALSTF